MLWRAPPGPRGTAWGTHQTASSVQPGDGWKAGDVTTNEETNLGGTALMRGDRSEHPAGERAPEATGGRAVALASGPPVCPSVIRGNKAKLSTCQSGAEPLLRWGRGRGV